VLMSSGISAKARLGPLFDRLQRDAGVLRRIQSS
jgi:hypothetical protein